eukprot:4857437-Prymnesium_polylepis.2
MMAQWNDHNVWGVAACVRPIGTDAAQELRQVLQAKVDGALRPAEVRVIAGREASWPAGVCAATSGLCSVSISRRSDCSVRGRTV